MTSFRRWLREKFANASRRTGLVARRIGGEENFGDVAEVSRAEDALVANTNTNTSDSEEETLSDLVVTERTRNGDPWVVIDHAGSESECDGDFFDEPNANDEFVVTERTRSGDMWIVVDRASDSKVISGINEDFFDGFVSKIKDFEENRVGYQGSRRFVVTRLGDTYVTLETTNEVKKSPILDHERFVLTERTYNGDPWIIVDHSNRRIEDQDGFFDDPCAKRNIIQDDQLVVSERTRSGDPWVIIDLPVACSSTANPNKWDENDGFFDCVAPLAERYVKDCPNYSDIDLQQYFHLNDSGDVRISFGVHVVAGRDFYGPKRWWRRISIGLEAKERKRTFWRRLVSGVKYLWRKYVSSPRTSSGGSSAAHLPRRFGEAPGARVRRYAYQLARDKTTTFAQNVDHFIACTRDGRERAPHVVMRNMRQFMSGMKNYLLKHGERGFEREVQLARARLRGDEFLNLDALLESVMQRLIAVPLREHLYALFVEWCAGRGDLTLMADNIKLAAEYEPRELGLRACVNPPSGAAMAAIAEQLTLLQEAESPLDKLDRLLRAVALVFEGTSGVKVVSADDFLPLLILVIARCGLVGAEIESELMWGLLQPSLLSGEAGYYLTALSSAVHVLKSLGAGASAGAGSKEQLNAAAMAMDGTATGAVDRPRCLPACGSLLRVVVPDEHQGSLQTRTLPVRPHTTAREVCRIIAHRARVTNPQDYGLFKLVDGEESLLADGECPQEARLSAEGKHCVLAYKRIDAKIAWPTAALVPAEDDC